MNARNGRNSVRFANDSVNAADGSFADDSYVDAAADAPVKEETATDAFAEGYAGGEGGGDALYDGYSAGEEGGDGVEAVDQAYGEESEFSTAILDAWDQKEAEKLAALEAELAYLDPNATPTVVALLREEIEKRKAEKIPNAEFMRSYADSVTLRQKIFVDLDNGPDINYVGQILGPGGQTAKRIALESNAKIAVQGKGSIRDKDHEEVLMQDGSPENAHLALPLHVTVETTAAPNRAWANMQRAVNMLIPLTRADGAGLPPPPPPASRGLGLRGRPYHRPAPYYAPYYPPAPPYGYPYAMRASGFGKMRGRGPRARGRIAPSM